MTGLFISPKPFLKWAGGKSQIIPELEKRLPLNIKKTKIIEQYIEPFVGGGAFFFFLKRKYIVKKAILIDINKELILCYKVIQKDHLKLINLLKKIENNFLKFPNEKRKKLFYEIREKFNIQKKNFDFETYNNSWIKRASLLIFLNKTCYNGLFRVNKKGEFNVPYGRYKNPRICDEKNIYEVHLALKNAEIICGDFEISKNYVDKKTFIYLDPPYRPLNNTSNFTNYTQNGFNDIEQKRLADFFIEMDKKDAYLMLSNSDPKNIDPCDNFFDNLYKDYNIERIVAKRFINSKGDKRGEIKELIIRNYE